MKKIVLVMWCMLVATSANTAFAASGEKDVDYVLWRVGLNMTTATSKQNPNYEFDGRGVDLTLQVFPFATDSSGIGLGVTGLVARDNKGVTGVSQSTTYLQQHLELLYNIDISDGTMLVPVLFVGTHSVAFTDINDVETTLDPETIQGVGLYLTSASVANKGNGFSGYVKGSKTENELEILSVGVQISW